MRVRFARACVGAFLCIAAALPAQAELRRVSIPYAGSTVDATRDTETGLDWLDVRLTANMAPVDFAGSAFYAAGFVHATKAQVQELFRNAHIPDDGYDLRFTRPQQAQALIELLGPLWGSSQSAGTAGITRTLVSGEDLPSGEWTFPPPVFQVGRVEYLDQRASGGGLVGEAHFTGDPAASDQRSFHVGSFLVRRADGCRAAGNSSELNCGPTR